ncbi:MAG: hypothetical protein KF745_14360 [Phycisphaeraceae bacterium]|nr:hypothetical protein [Phycisphaeraceae bacterium]
MTTYELLEMATLDAMGLLDDEERESFERAFFAAAPAVQAQIRREQARLARNDAILPAGEPPAGLRARVLAAVRDAMQAVSGRTIAGRISPAILPSRGVSPVWRAAAIGCVAASIVFGLTTAHMRSQFDNITKQLSLDLETAAWIRDWGPRFEQRLFDPGTRFVSFSGEASGRAVLLMDNATGSGQLLFKDLPASEGTYSLAIVDSEGNPVGTAVLTFKSAGNKSFQPIKGLDLKSIPEGCSLAILAPSEKAAGRQTPLLRSAGT